MGVDMETAQPQPGILRILGMIWKGRTEASREELDALAGKLEAEDSPERRQESTSRPAKGSR
jgi:hypothetical protein